MADAGFFKGTSADQDRRFSDKELKLLKTMKFPPEFDKKVDMKKVNLQVIKPWIAKKVTELVGLEDEVVVEYAMGLLEDPNHTTPDPKKMQINLNGFLTSSTPAFMTALWSLLLEAQDSPAGVPKTFVEEKKEEMRKARESDQRAFGERDRRARLDDIRENERADRGGRGRGRSRGRGRGGFDGGGRGRDSGWGRRGGGGGDGRHGRRFSSRSPPPQRHRSPSGSPFDARSSRSPPPPSNRPSRTPAGRRPSRTPQRYSSPPARRSRSRSPPPQRSRRRYSRSPSPPRRRQSPSIAPSRGRSRSLSLSPPPSRRRKRSPSRSRSPPRRYGGGKDRRRASRSPPLRRRRFSRSPTPPSSRSPSPLPRYGRRRSPSPRGGRKGGRDSSSRSRTSPPPRRRDSRERDRAVEETRRRGRSSSPAAMAVDKAETRSRTLDSDLPQNSRGELKIKGQANARKSKWDDEETEGQSTKDDGVGTKELEKRENELKERALRNKVIRTRKGSGSVGATFG